MGPENGGNGQFFLIKSIIPLSAYTDPDWPNYNRYKIVKKNFFSKKCPSSKVWFMKVGKSKNLGRKTVFPSFIDV